MTKDQRVGRRIVTLTNRYAPNDWINKFGYNSDVDSAAAEDIWNQGGKWVAPTQARTHQIASSDDADNGGTATGALTVKIYGLDSNWDRQNEDITLNGTTDVPTVNTYIRVFRMEVLTVGSGGSNAGNITATADTDGTVTCSISIGDNQSLFCIYTIPNNIKGYLESFTVHTDPSQAAVITVNLLSRKDGGPWRVRHRLILNDSSPSTLHEFDPPKNIVAKEDVLIEVASTANNIPVSGSFDIVLEPV